MSVDESDLEITHLASSGNGIGGIITKRDEKLRRNPLILFIYEPLVGGTA